MTAPQTAPTDLLRAAPAHAAVLTSLHAASFAAPWGEGEFAALLMQPGVGGWIARAQDEPVAFILVRSAADEAEILTLAVQPAHRRRGFAADLVNEACRSLRAAGARRLFLEVAHDNAPARRLYARCGFAEDGRRKNYYREGRETAVDAVLMSRAL